MVCHWVGLVTTYLQTKFEVASFFRSEDIEKVRKFTFWWVLWGSWGHPRSSATWSFDRAPMISY